MMSKSGDLYESVIYRCVRDYLLTRWRCWSRIASGSHQMSGSIARCVETRSIYCLTTEHCWTSYATAARMSEADGRSH